MSQELLYTSAPHGLKPGSRGFCTVLSTQGMAAPLASALEGLSGYRPVYPPGDERTELNPVNWSHVTLPVAGRTWHILSRVAEYGLDYSQRTNKLAHHVVLDAAELITAGPAALLLNQGFMRAEWHEEPHLAPPKPVQKIPPLPRGVCQAWKEVTGDGGWAGVLAESFLRDPERPVILLYTPGQDMLPLIAEAISLIPADRRWDVTFSTYFTGLPQSVNCNWRCMLSGSQEAHQSLRFVRALRLDLSNPNTLGIPAGNDLVAAARGMPRLKASISGNLPPLPSEMKDVVEDKHQELGTNGELQADELPPLPGSNVYQTQQATSPPSHRGLQKSTVAFNAADDLILRRKRALLFGLMGIVLLALLIGVVFSIGRAVRVDAHRPLAGGSTERPSVKPQKSGHGVPSKAGVKSPPRSTVDASIPQSTHHGEKKLALTTAAPIQKSGVDSDRGSNDTVRESDGPSIEPVATAPRDTNVPAEIGVSLAKVENQAKELWSRRGTSNPFLSLKLFSPETAYVSGTEKKDGQAIRLDLKETGTTTGASFATILSNAPEDRSTTQLFEYKLTLRPSKNTKSIERLRWCELDVESKGATPAGTHIKFHDFPLNREAQKVAFCATDDGGLKAKWNLGIVAESNVPQMLMTSVHVQIGGVDYPFAFSKMSDGDNGSVISSFRCDALNARVRKVLTSVKESDLSDAMAITMHTEATSGDGASLEPVAVVLRMSAMSKLKKDVAVDLKMKDKTRESCEKAIRCLKEVRPIVDIKCIREAFKSPTTDEIVSAVNEFERHKAELPKIQVRNEIARKSVLNATEATTKAISELNELKVRVAELTEFENSLKQCHIKSADLHYQINSPKSESRNVFIFRTTE